MPTSRMMMMSGCRLAVVKTRHLGAPPPSPPPPLPPSLPLPLSSLSPPPSLPPPSPSLSDRCRALNPKPLCIPTAGDCSQVGSSESSRLLRVASGVRRRKEAETPRAVRLPLPGSERARARALRARALGSVGASFPLALSRYSKSRPGPGPFGRGPGGQSAVTVGRRRARPSGVPGRRGRGRG